MDTCVGSGEGGWRGRRQSAARREIQNVPVFCDFDCGHFSGLDATYWKPTSFVVSADNPEVAIHKSLRLQLYSRVPIVTFKRMEL